jgi:uncharacterized membrane protein
LLLALAVAMLAAALAADVAGTLTGLPALWIGAWYLSLAGAVTGLLALMVEAVRRLIVRTPRHVTTRWMVGHIVLTPFALLLFALAWYVRGAPEIPPDPATLLIQGVALALLLLGGWMGLRART